MNTLQPRSVNEIKVDFSGQLEAMGYREIHRRISLNSGEEGGDMDHELSAEFSRRLPEVATLLVQLLEEGGFTNEVFEGLISTFVNVAYVEGLRAQNAQHGGSGFMVEGDLEHFYRQSLVDAVLRLLLEKLRGQNPSKGPDSEIGDAVVGVRREIDQA